MASRLHVFVVSLMALAAPAQAAEDFLDPAAAFRFSARMADARTIAVTFDIAEGYYMYRERFAFSAQGATLGTPSIPPGKIKFDQTFNKEVATHRRQVVVLVPVSAAGPFTLNAIGQGCADQGLCYAPQQYKARLAVGREGIWGSGLQVTPKPLEKTRPAG